MKDDVDFIEPCCALCRWSYSPHLNGFGVKYVACKVDFKNHALEYSCDEFEPKPGTEIK